MIRIIDPNLANPQIPRQLLRGPKKGAGNRGRWADSLNFNLGLMIFIGRWQILSEKRWGYDNHRIKDDGKI